MFSQQLEGKVKASFFYYFQSFESHGQISPSNPDNTVASCDIVRKETLRQYYLCLVASNKQHSEIKISADCVEK